MEKDETFSVYRTPFKCKFKICSKTSPPKQVYNKYHSAASQNNLINSPYSVKYVKNYQTVKVRTAFARQENIQDRIASTVSVRMKSAPQKPSKLHEVVEQQKGEQFNNYVKQIRTQANILKEAFVRSASRRKFNKQDELFYTSCSLSRRKFTISFVNLAKQREKSRRLIDKKLEKYNYKAVLGDPLPFRTKKVSKLIINQSGIIRHQKS